MAAKQLSRVEAMPEDDTSRKPPRLPLPFPSNVIKLQSTDRREKLRIVEAWKEHEREKQKEWKWEMKGAKHDEGDEEDEDN